ncbi:uncharacterized protein LOC122800438 [Protopterus annectens]|uniref:uncharacterized protein LOC122800438 n=1 Tax=Protopterus annectens TaxID=7888 RepID=UPI001CF9A193|nr:uncharacterized protein LOC122800438 [Protopterus annectens]
MIVKTSPIRVSIPVLDINLSYKSEESSNTDLFSDTDTETELSDSLPCSKCCSLGVLAAENPLEKGEVDNGELCIEGIQCKSKCCYKRHLLDLARCAPLSKENAECSPNYIWDVYYRCPCEAGLKCETDRTIIGGITHKDFGICMDPNQPRKQVAEEQKPGDHENTETASEGGEPSQPASEVRPEDTKFINLNNGELCIEGIQCKSKCCYRRHGLDLARCAPMSKENAECSPNYIWDVYYRCPCEAGLKCETDRTIIGGITHTDFGICMDPNEPRKQVVEEQKPGDHAKAEIPPENGKSE